MVTRDQWTVTTFGERHRDKIEAAVKELGVPTAHLEVAWWNRGLRRADRISVEVATTVPIETWEVQPPAQDIAGGWVCTHDPSLNDADRHRLRLEQAALMPGTHCRLVLGYSPSPLDDTSPKARAYYDDREIKNYTTAPGLSPCDSSLDPCASVSRGTGDQRGSPRPVGVRSVSIIKPKSQASRQLTLDSPGQS
jgi:hypothetical protein